MMKKDKRLKMKFQIQILDFKQHVETLIIS